MSDAAVGLLLVAGGVFLLALIVGRYEHALGAQRRAHETELARLAALWLQQEGQQREWIERLLAATERNVDLAERSATVVAAALHQTTRLTPERRANLGRALLDAFPGGRATALRDLLRAIGGEDGVHALDWSAPLTDVVDNMIVWSESRDLTPALVRAARQANPTNSLLDRWARGGTP